MNINKAKWKMRCVIYDCDGVLFDSLEANTKLYNDLCALGGRAPLREEEIKYIHTHTVYEAVHFIFGKDEGAEKKALELLKQVDFREYIAYLKMEPHLLQTLGYAEGKWNSQGRQHQSDDIDAACHGSI